MIRARSVLTFCERRQMKQGMSVETEHRQFSRRLGPQAKWMLSEHDPKERVLVVLRLNASANEAAIEQTVIAADGRIRAWLPTQRVLAAETPLSSIDRLARLDGVVSLDIDAKLGPV